MELVPVERCGIAVIERQESISRRDVTARHLEVHLVKVRNVACRDAVVDIQRVVRRSRLAAAISYSFPMVVPEATASTALPRLTVLPVCRSLPQPSSQFLPSSRRRHRNGWCRY